MSLVKHPVGQKPAVKHIHRNGGHSAAERRSLNHQAAKQAGHELRQFEKLFKQKVEAPKEGLIWSRVEQLSPVARMVFKAALFSVAFATGANMLSPALREIFGQLLTHLETHSEHPSDPVAGGAAVVSETAGSGVAVPVDPTVSSEVFNASLTAQHGPDCLSPDRPKPPPHSNHSSSAELTQKKVPSGRLTQARWVGGRRVPHVRMPRGPLSKMAPGSMATRPRMDNLGLLKTVTDAANNAIHTLGQAATHIPLFNFPAAEAGAVYESPTPTMESLRANYEEMIRVRATGSSALHVDDMRESPDGDRSRRQTSGFLSGFPSLALAPGETVHDFRPVYEGDTTIMTFNNQNGVPKAVVLLPVLQSPAIELGAANSTDRVTTLVNNRNTIMDVHVTPRGNVEVATNSVVSPGTPTLRTLSTPAGHVPEVLFSTNQDGAILVTQGNGTVNVQGLGTDGSPTSLNATVSVPASATNLHMCQPEGGPCNASLLYVDSGTLHMNTFNTTTGAHEPRELARGVSGVRTQGRRVYYEQDGRSYTGIVGNTGLTRVYELPPFPGGGRQVGTLLTNELASRVEFEGLGPSGGFLLSVHTTYDTNVSRISAFRDPNIKSFVVNPGGDLVGVTEFTGSSISNSDMTFFLVKPDGTRSSVPVGVAMDAVQHVSTSPTDGRKYVIQLEDSGGSRHLDGTYILDPDMVVPNDQFQCRNDSVPGGRESSSTAAASVTVASTSGGPAVGGSSPGKGSQQGGGSGGSGDSLLIPIVVGVVCVAVVVVVVIAGKARCACFKRQKKEPLPQGFVGNPLQQDLAAQTLREVVATTVAATLNAVEGRRLSSGDMSDVRKDNPIHDGGDVSAQGKTVVHPYEEPVSDPFADRSSTRSGPLPPVPLAQGDVHVVNPHYSDIETLRQGGGIKVRPSMKVGGVTTGSVRDTGTLQRGVKMAVSYAGDPDVRDAIEATYGDNAEVFIDYDDGEWGGGLNGTVLRDDIGFEDFEEDPAGNLKTHPLFMEGGAGHDWLNWLDDRLKQEGLDVYKMDVTIMQRLYETHPTANDDLFDAIKPLLYLIAPPDSVYSTGRETGSVHYKANPALRQTPSDWRRHVEEFGAELDEDVDPGVDKKDGEVVTVKKLPSHLVMGTNGQLSEYQVPGELDGWDDLPSDDNGDDSDEGC